MPKAEQLPRNRQFLVTWETGVSAGDPRQAALAAAVQAVRSGNEFYRRAVPTDVPRSPAPPRVRRARDFLDAYERWTAVGVT